MITHTEFSVIALIGIILLIGIVQKNAIMMIDFALQAERGEGKTAEAAIFQACQLRFRPILMTTNGRDAGWFTALAGRRRGRRAAQAAGHHHRRRLIMSQALTLYTVPVIYLYFDKLAQRLKPRELRISKEQQPEIADSY